MIKNAIGIIILFIKTIIFRKKWRIMNGHNFTNAERIFDTDKVIIGNYTYGNINPSFFGNPHEKLTIGNFCSIANGVEFLLGGEHHPEFLMNYPFKLYLCPHNSIDDRKTKGPININDDVWIGRNAIILSGVTIGKGAVIAAGSIVSKDVPPYAIYTTNRIIKYRFSQNIIDKLLQIDFSKVDFKFAEKNMDIFYRADVDKVLMSDEFDVLISRYLKEKNNEYEV